jgi:hypothetical protein
MLIMLMLMVAVVIRNDNRYQLIACIFAAGFAFSGPKGLQRYYSHMSGAVWSSHSGSWSLPFR